MIAVRWAEPPERVKRHYCMAMGIAHLHDVPPRVVGDRIEWEPGTITYEDRHWMEVWEMSDGTWKQFRMDLPTQCDEQGRPL